MHRSVLENGKYVKFSAANAVEVISMEEIDRAIREKSHTIATYKAKDAYGDEVEYLREFPGLTLDELKDLSNTNAILAFMEGGKIPYTAIVDPHSGKAIFAMKGKPTVKSLTAAIARARAKLEKEHGKGVDRKLWSELGAIEVKVDTALAKGEYVDAVKLHGAILKKFPRARGAVKARLDAMRAAIEKDIAVYVDGGKAKKAELERLAAALGQSPLAARIRKLLAR